MLKKTITYTDFNGNEVTEDHYFHLSKAELVEMEVSQKGGLYEYLQQIVKDEDGKAIIQQFKNLLIKSHGKISEDGRRFVKDWELSNQDFAETEAYSTLFMELVTDANAAAEFVNGIIPSGLNKDMEKIQTTPKANPPQVITRAELVAMDSDELKNLISLGYIVSDE